MAPRDESILAPEEVAQVRHAASVIALFAGELARRDTDLQSLLGRVLTLRSEAGEVRQDDPAVHAALIWDHIQSEVAGLSTEVRRLAAICEREPLVTEGFVVQTNEIMRNLRADIHQAPALSADLTAVAVGGALQGMIDRAVMRAVAAVVPEIVATIPEVVAAALLAVAPAPAELPPAADPLIIVDIEASPAPRHSRRKTG